MPPCRRPSPPPTWGGTGWGSMNDLVDVVLVRPRNPANVAAACRALKNMGLGSLRLVGDDPGLGRPEARNLAYGAWDLLDGVRFFPGLDEAVADASFVAGT